MNLTAQAKLVLVRAKAPPGTSRLAIRPNWRLLAALAATTGFWILLVVAIRSI